MGEKVQESAVGAISDIYAEDYTLSESWNVLFDLKLYKIWRRILKKKNKNKIKEFQKQKSKTAFDFIL